MSMDELHALATNIGAEQNDDQTTLIYNIIDKESEVGSTEVSTEVQPKKRGRKSKAEKEALAAIQAQQQEQTTANTTEAEKTQPKKRGRKSKKEAA